MSITIQRSSGAFFRTQSSSAEERPATLSERTLAGLGALSTSAAQDLATRRLVRLSERRRQRAVTIVCTALVTLSASGTLTFATLLVAGR